MTTDPTTPTPPQPQGTRLPQVLETIGPAPWVLDEDTVRDATGHGVCRLDWEDEQGRPTHALLHDSNVELILQAPVLGAQVAAARELITLWRSLGDPMLLAAARDLEERFAQAAP